MSTERLNLANRHHHTFDTTFRKDHHMQHVELRLADAQERQALYRVHRDADRHADGRDRTLRRQLGQSLVRLGHRVAGDAMTTPAWQG